MVSFGQEPKRENRNSKLASQPMNSIFEFRVSSFEFRPSSVMVQLADKVPMHRWVIRQLRMKRSRQNVALLHQNGKISAAAQHAHAFSHAADNGSANEYHLHGMIG